ncbi:MAG TPA: CHAD domain-containing protein [Bryobacteraceae bacterium]|jgi:CHAD domain-containing protein|nr:CHAD domain-containing protein [Bryobacteraceae bacterium]
MAKLDPAAKIAIVATRRFARDQADKLLGRLAFQISRAIKSHNSDAVHDLRVTIRRFAQALRAFKPCFHGKEVRKIRRELKGIMTVAGEVRNHDIALKLLAKSKRAQRSGIQPKIQSGRREAERSLITLLKRWLERKSSLKWRTELESAAAQAEDNFSKATIAQTARQMLPALAQDFFEQGDEAAGDKAIPREMHRFRLTSKKFRYTLELFAPLDGQALNSELETIRRGQTLLGDINDFETVRDMVSQYEGADTVIVWLKRRQRKRLVEFREYWNTTFGPKEVRQEWIDFLEHLAPEPRASKKPAGRSTAEPRVAARGSAAVA